MRDVCALRTCLGCRQVKPKATLVRLVREVSGAVRVDRTASAPGRGAYVCADASCIERALKAGRLSHAFRKPCRVEPDVLAALVTSAGPAAGTRVEVGR